MYINKGEIITIAGGHVGNAGACYYNRKEEDLTKELALEIVKILTELGFKAYDVSPVGSYNQNNQLTAEITNANKYNSKLHICLHFNACATHKGVGSEAWVYGLGGIAETYGKQICREISKLGFNNRGVKVSTGLRVPRETKAPCVLQEICFMDNLTDINRYSYKDVAKSIVKAITGIDYISNSNNTNTSNVKYRVISDAFKSKEFAIVKQEKLKNKGYESFLDFKNEKYYVVVGSFNIKECADKRVIELKNNGFNSFIDVVKIKDVPRGTI